MALNDTHTVPSNPLDVDRLITTSIDLAVPKTIQEADMLEALEALTLEQRTEIMTDWYLFWVTWHTQFAMGVE
jgi:hypothetical protein